MANEMNDLNVSKIGVGYVRCSTEMQEGSPEQQIKEIEKWASQNEFKVLRWYIDRGKSGTTFIKRPKFTELIRDVENNPNFEYVLVYDESRWGRPNNPRENTYWKMHFERYGIKVIIINSQSKRENDIGSFVVEVVESAEASEYSKKLARATLRGAVSNAEKGFYNGGTAPYGLVRIAIDKVTGAHKRVLREGEQCNPFDEKVKLGPGDPLEVRFLKLIFELRLRGYGYRAIANHLNQENVPCPRRGKWRNLNQRWGMSTIKGIIENPAYRGALVYNRFPMTKKRIGEIGALGKKKLSRRSPQKELIIVENAHEAIVSKEDWSKVNESKSRSYSVHNHRFRESPFLLTGILKCMKCGFNFQGSTQIKKYSNPNWMMNKEQYYKDGGYHSKGIAVCDPLLIRKDMMESFVIESIKAYVTKSNIAQNALYRLEEYIEKETVDNSEEETILTAIEENKKKTKNLINLAESGVKVESVLQRIQELEHANDLLQEQLRSIDKRRPEKSDIKMMAIEIERIVNNFQNEFQNGTLADQKDQIRRFVSAVVIHRTGQPRAHCYIRKIPLINQSTGLSLQYVAGEGFEPTTCGL
jgi:DNA invertase Pin-like site-specific DNA recombinase